MMNFWRTTHAELFAEHFLCFYQSRSLQVCASGATEHSVLLFTAVIWHCLLLPPQKSHCVNSCLFAVQVQRLPRAVVEF